MMLHSFLTRQVKLAKDANKEKKPGNVWRNLVSNPSCRGQNKTIITIDYRSLTRNCVLIREIYLLNFIWDSGVQVDDKCKLQDGERCCTCKMT